MRTEQRIGAEVDGTDPKGPERSHRRGEVWKEWQWIWVLPAVITVVVLIVVIFDDVQGVYESQQDVFISLIAAALGFFLGKVRQKTARQITSDQLVRLLQADPLAQPEPRPDYDENVAAAFVASMERELRKPVWLQDKRIREAVEVNIATFLRSLDFTDDSAGSSSMSSRASVTVRRQSSNGQTTAHGTPGTDAQGSGHESAGESAGGGYEGRGNEGADVYSPDGNRVRFMSNLNLVLTTERGVEELRRSDEASDGTADPVALALDDSIRQYRDDHRILSHLTRVDRDIHACGQRLAEYWDQRAGSPSFPVEAPVLEVIMSDVESAANAVIRLNGIFRNRDSLLGTEPRRMGLEDLDPDAEVERVKAGEDVEFFQAAFRSATEAKNRYFDLLLLLDEADAGQRQGISSLRIAGSDTAKALRLFRSVNYAHSRSSQRAVTLQVLGYLEAARARMTTWEAPEMASHSRDVELIGEVFKGDLAAAVDYLRSFLNLAGAPEVQASEGVSA